MGLTNYILTFNSIDEEQITFEVSDKGGKISVRYNMKNEDFSFENQHHLSEILAKNQFQLKKIITSAIKGKLTPGQQINFVFIENFPFLNNHDFNHFIQVYRRNKKVAIHVREKETENIHKIYADGSYARDLNQSGYAGVVEDKRGNREVFHASFSSGSSNLMELLAVAEGLKRLVTVEKIQINTDSRFVIRGIAQWVHFWRLNNWQTAHGREVKFAKHWQQIDTLSEGKLLELKWIKAHSGDVNHGFCHQLAKQIATCST